MHSREEHLEIDARFRGKPGQRFAASVPVEVAGQGVEIPDADLGGLHREVEALLGLDLSSPRADLLGHVGRHGHQAADSTLLADGLEVEAEDAFLPLSRVVAIERDAHLGGEEGLAGAIDAVEDIEEALSFELGQDLAEGAADEVLAADEALVARIREQEDVLRAAPGGDRHRRLVEELGDASALVLGLGARGLLGGERACQLLLGLAGGPQEARAVLVPKANLCPRIEGVRRQILGVFVRKNRRHSGSEAESKTRAGR